MSYFNKIQTQMADSFSIDAFGRQRVSQVSSLFDGKMLNDNQPLRWDDAEMSGGGTSSTYNTNKASVSLGVGATTAGKRVRQTFRRFNYVPAKSQLIFITFTLGTQSEGITRSVGYGDEKNGIFLKDTGTGYQLIRRSYVTGTAVDTPVDQADWNIDPMLDGSGPSGKTIDFTKSQIIVMDMEWLGVGRVRIGVVIDGGIYYLHQFVQANHAVGVYMSTPNLPIRYELENDGTGPAATLECICASVASEGGVDPIGTPFGLSTGLVSSLSSGTTYALLGARLKSTHIDIATVLSEASLVCSTVNDAFVWSLRGSPTIAGSPTYGSLANSAIEYFVGTTSNTVTGGHVIRSGVGFTGNVVHIDGKLDESPLGQKLDGTRTTLALCITPITDNLTVAAALSWRELG